MVDDAQSKALEVLERLREESSQHAAPSWIQQQSVTDAEKDDTRSSACRFFDYTGFLHIPSFVDRQECCAMKEQMAHLVETQWNVHSMLESFGTDQRQNTARGDYFLKSADKVHFFAEPEAVVQEKSTSSSADDGKNGGRPLLKLRPQYYRAAENLVEALNKAGHALHLQPGVFADYCRSDKVRDLVLDLGWKDPVVPQSMYIFKQSKIGGAVSSHQDSTFLYTTPKQTCLGLWLALDDATIDNGCLWVRPKSHREAVRRQYKRNPAHFGNQAIDARSNVAAGNLEEPMFVMEYLYEHDDVSWDGSIPSNEGSSSHEGLLEAGFIPIECKAGDLLAFCGELDHLSLPNSSDKARHTFQLHLVEGPAEAVTWSKSNWLQYPDGRPFLRLLE